MIIHNNLYKQKYRKRDNTYETEINNAIESMVIWLDDNNNNLKINLPKPISCTLAKGH